MNNNIQKEEEDVDVGEQHIPKADEWMDEWTRVCARCVNFDMSRKMHCHCVIFRGSLFFLLSSNASIVIFRNYLAASKWMRVGCIDVELLIRCAFFLHFYAVH